MSTDRRYDIALAAALVILSEIDKQPEMAKPQCLSLMVFSILHAIDCWEEEKGEIIVESSVN